MVLASCGSEQAFALYLWEALHTIFLFSALLLLAQHSAEVEEASLGICVLLGACGGG